MSLRNRHLAQVIVLNGIYRKATHGQMQGDYNDSSYVASCTPTSSLRHLRVGLFQQFDFYCTECNTCFKNLHLCILPTKCIYWFRIILS
jgi:hypothetical protein